MHLLASVLWMEVINHRRDLLFSWNCIHISPSNGGSLHLEALPRGQMNRQKETVNERAEEEKTPPLPPISLLWSSEWQLITGEKAVTRLLRTEFGSDLWNSEPSCAEAVDTQLDLLYRCRESKISLRNDYSGGQEAISLNIYSDVSVVPVYRYWYYRDFIKVYFEWSIRINASAL